MDNEFTIGNWQVDRKQCLLISDQQKKTLEPQAMTLLFVLAEANGELVSREQLIKKIWGDRFVTDYALNTLVGNLRKSLAEHSNPPDYIETRPKLGYRLVPDIIWSTATNDVNSTETANQQQVKKNSNSHSRLARYGALTISVVSIVTLILKFIPLSSNNSTVEELPESTQHFSEKLHLENTINDFGVQPENTDYVKSQIKEGDLSVGHMVKLYLSYTFSARDQNGKLYCEDFSYGMINRSIYSDGHWRVIGAGVTMHLDHQSDSLTNVSETHTMEYINLIGKKEVDITTMNYDKDGQLSGTADMKIYDDTGMLICEGNSVFFGTKF